MAPWTVNVGKRVEKQIENLPSDIKKIFVTLLAELEKYGPVRGAWPNYGKLDKKRHHCHLKRGQPTYVVVWTVVDSKLRIIKVSYVGTHENAPY